MDRLEEVLKKIQSQGKEAVVAVKKVFEKAFSKIHQHELAKMTLAEVREAT